MKTTRLIDVHTNNLFVSLRVDGGLEIGCNTCSASNLISINSSDQHFHIGLDNCKLTVRSYPEPKES